MDNVLIVVDDLDAVISFFVVELGMKLEGKGPIEGRWAERVIIGIDDVRQDVATLRTPDGHGRIDLALFHTPKAISAEPKDAPANTWQPAVWRRPGPSIAYEVAFRAGG
ncbi:hypothetical protein U2F26_28025 [Micromonospora sp. 4G57]|uniref:Glyoxalase/fosfomycin resistance/dioxygenase domain-containing protein n=2 Tax=Micromonosporaceae TaxID=28056 RepID=A0ABU5JNX4_9ACTN|nr:VOC family protein [Micromonospora sp. 4G57]MDZ5446527.1 hypothetical protein [Micromonospora sp. 4G57]MDZ5494236.1 hypothetical protein [Micromonospora sp. 4G53]